MRTTGAKLQWMHSELPAASARRQLDAAPTQLKLSKRIRADAETDGMYAGIRQATGPTTTKKVPLNIRSGENITDQKESDGAVGRALP